MREDYPHYVELQPREPRNAREELGAAGVFVIIVTLVAWMLSGCASAAAPNVTPEAPFELRLQPAFAFPGSDVRLTCHVPESLGRGVIRLALEGATATGPARLEHVQTSLLVQRVECGTWKATCWVDAEGGVRYAERTLEVKGGMCDGQDKSPAR